MKRVSRWPSPGSPRLGPAIRRIVIGLLAVTASIALSVGAASASIPSAGVGSAVTEHQALTVPANPTVGPLFTNGIDSDHSCTASVLSAGRGLLLTAAHCLSGRVQGIQFVPGYDGTKADTDPYGVWTVSRAWLPAGWVNGQDEEHDIAILQVQDAVVGGRSTSLTDLVGGNAIGIATRGIGGAAGVEVTVPAYISGIGDAPISCTAALQHDQGFQSFGCAGYLGGTSGAPWIETAGFAEEPAVVGVIGGLHQGGCTDSTSYSSDFDSDVYLLMIRAVLGLPSDTAPTPPGDGC